MHTLKAPAMEGAGPGLVRVTGSFTTDGSGNILVQRPTRINCTVTRKAAGVYVVQYAQPCLSVVFADAWVGYSANIVGSGNVNLPTSVSGFVNCSADFMTSDGTHFTADPTNTSFLILVYAPSANPTSLTLTDVYGLGNTGGVANYRVNFEFLVSTSTMNQ